jgi:hypothetical protein
MSKPKFPPLKELAQLCASLKKEISDEYRASDDPGDDTPGMQLTVGADGKGGWSWQTGDNSYSGGAYHYPHWAVVSLYRDSKCSEVAKEIRSELEEAYWQANG